MNTVKEQQNVDEVNFTGNWFCNKGELFFEIEYSPVYGYRHEYVTTKKRKWYVLWLFSVDTTEAIETEYGIIWYQNRGYISESDLVDINTCSNPPS